MTSEVEEGPLGLLRRVMAGTGVNGLSNSSCSKHAMFHILQFYHTTAPLIKHSGNYHNKEDW